MAKKVIFLSVVLGVCLTSLVQAANIIWVSDDKNGTNAPSDQGFVDLLRAQGYNVDYQGQGGTGTAGYQFWRTLDDTKIATLNASDLIILSRDTNSGDYASNATEVGQWNGIKKPLLMLVAHVARNDRWQWVETTGQADASPVLQAVKLDHPIFAGVTLDANNRVNVFTGIGSISSATSAGNGTLIATRADNNQVWIAEWKTGQVFKPTTTQTAGGQRMLFAAGATGAGGPDGTLNLTAEGQKMFLNAVRYLLGETGARYAATAPNPADKATDVARDVTLGWTAGKYAATHDVYVGLSSADVNNAARTAPLGVLASQDQSAGSYAPAGLEFGQTYYWRVDEVNAPPSTAIIKGNTWSLTVEPFAYPIQGVTATASSVQEGMGPERSIDGSGLNAAGQHSVEAKEMWMSTGVQPNWIQYEFDKVYQLSELWVWNSNQIIEAFIGFGAKSVKIEYSVDGNTWTELAGVPEFAKATGTPTYTHNTTVSFGGVLAKYVKLTINSTWGGIAQTGLSEVQFSYVPVGAREPQPASGATGVDLDVTLNWRPGREAASHEVYFSSDQNAVTNGTAPAVTVTDHSYRPASLQFGTTYYWRVDEIGAAATPGTQAGDVWSFTTQEYATIDDIESYNDDDNRIYDTWVDGLTDGKSGSIVGYDKAPFAELTIIHGGKQSMPMSYDNTAKFSFSEAVRTFDTAQSWTAHGIQSLSLYFQGAAANTGGQLYVKINNIKVSYNGNVGDLAKPAWTPWNIDLSSVGAGLSTVTSLTIGIEGSGKGIVYLDDIRLYPKAPEYSTPVDPGKTNLVALYALDGNANDSSGKGNNGTVNGTGLWVPGQINQALQFNGTSTYVDCGSGASLNLTDAVTITAWVKMDFTAGDRKIAGNQDNVGGGYKMGLYSNNKAEFEIRTAANTTTSNRAATGGTALQQGVWYHVAGVYSQGQYIRTYVYGNLDRETLTTASAGSSTVSFKLGRETYGTGSYYWLGVLDDVEVYSRVLSQEEILWLAGQKTPVAKPF